MFKTLRFVLALFLSALALPLSSASQSRAAAAKPPVRRVALTHCHRDALRHRRGKAGASGRHRLRLSRRPGLPTKRINCLNPSVEAVWESASPRRRTRRRSPTWSSSPMTPTRSSKSSPASASRSCSKTPRHRSQRPQPDRQLGHVDRSRREGRRARDFDQRRPSRGHQVNSAAPEQEDHRLLRSRYPARTTHSRVRLSSAR
jgi:hypothetical protein